MSKLREEIIAAWTFLKENPGNISEETLDFIRDAALEKLNELEKSEIAHDRLIRGRRES